MNEDCDLQSLFKEHDNDRAQLDELERWLKEHSVSYDRIDEMKGLLFRWNQIIVYDDAGERLFDAICHLGSYGYEEGLLEVMGAPVVDQEKGGVAGWLTAAEVIERYERWSRSNE